MHSSSKVRVDEGALTECSSSSEKCVHSETALAAPSSRSGRAPLPCLLQALRSGVQATLLCHSRSIACYPLKKKHLTTESGRRRELYENHKKALRSELAAKRMQTRNQLARVAETKRLWDTVSKEMLAYQCAGFRTFHDLPGVFNCTEDGIRRREKPAKEKVADLTTHVGTNTAMALPTQLCGSPNTESQ